jgi:hypothetical protein
MWDDNIKMDTREIGFEGMDWCSVALDTKKWQVLENMIMNLWVP